MHHYIFKLVVVNLLLYDSVFKSRLREAENAAEAPCDGNIAIIGCANTELEKILSNSRTILFETKLTTSTICANEPFEYEWEIEGEVHNHSFNTKTKTFLSIEPYVLSGGYHSIAVRVRRKGATEIVFQELCSFVVKSEVPIAVIAGGSERTVPSGEEFVVDGAQSIDLDVPPGGSPKLTYKWTCSVEGTAVKEFCQKQELGSGKYLRVPAKYAIGGHKYTFTLSIKTPQSDWQRASQTVHVKQGAAMVQINCKKNCPPVSRKTNSKLVTHLKAICLKKCANLQPNSYEWTVDGGNFNYEENTQFGRNTDKFVIKPEVLTAGSKYTIRVKLKDGLIGGAVKEIEIHQPPKIESCSVSPSSGEALKTTFTVDCKYDQNQEYSFKIYSVINNHKILLRNGAKLSEMRFILASKASISVKMFDEFNFYDTANVQVTVNAAIQSGDSGKNVKKAIFNNYADPSNPNSVKSLLKKQQFDEALAGMAALTDELAAVASRDKDTMAMAVRLQKTVLVDLKRFPLVTRVQVGQVARLSSKVAVPLAGKPHPQVAALATTVCKGAAEALLQQTQNDRFAASAAPVTHEIVGALVACSEDGSTPNSEALIPSSSSLNLTTPSAPLDVPVVQEDYPDYIDDDDEVIGNVKNFEQASNSFMEICKFNTKTIALSLSIGEETVVSSSQYCKATATRISGEDADQMDIDLKDVRLQLSLDLKKITNPINILLCTSTMNPFWWNRKQTILTSVASVQIIETNRNIVQFSSPNRVSFKFKGATTRIFRGCPEFKVANWSEDDISILRIEVHRWQAVNVEFHNLTDQDHLNAVLTDFVKPKLSDFSNSEKIDKNRNILHFLHRHNYDGWRYIGLLPHPGMENLTDSWEYRISVQGFSCYFWNASEKNWNRGCMPKEDRNNETITCECNHLSIFAGDVENLSIKIDRLARPNFGLVLLKTYIISIFVSTICGIYCVAIVAKMMLAPKGRDLYYLCDHSHFDRFAYLVIVKTGGWWWGSGTTSSICVKIFGAECATKSHVLNYPDPELRLLQRNGEDWFVIASNRHLGELQTIWLWADWVGRRPSWRCQAVVVFDLQQRRRWDFQINRQLQLCPAEKAIITATPAGGDQKAAKFRHLLQGWQETELAFLERATVMLSSALTTGTFVLLFYGFPELKLRDGFDFYSRFYLYPYVFLTAICCSVFSFSVHIPLDLLLRSPEKPFIPTQKRIDGLNLNIICWSLIIFNIVLQMALLLVFGFWVPFITSLLWLTSTITACIINIFILTNFYKYVKHKYLKTNIKVEKIFHKYDLIIRNVEEQRKFIFNKFGQLSLRPYLKHLYRKLDEDEIKIKRAKFQTNFEIWEILEDAFIFIIYMVLLYLVIFANRNDMSVMSNRAMEELLNGVHTRSLPFEEVKSLQLFRDYLEHTLIPAMQSPIWYENFVLNDPGLMVDFQTKYLGIARIRQHRTVANFCTVPDEMRFLHTQCNPEYFVKRELKAFPGSRNRSEDRLWSVWGFTGALKSGAAPYIGKFGIYTGGFIAPLGRTMYNSLINLKYLVKKKWFDEITRALFIEFLAYNPNCNLFNSIQLITEISASGFYRHKYQIQTTTLLFVNDESETMAVTIFFCFLLIVVILLAKLSWRIYKMRRLFLKDLWNVVDLLIVVLCVSCFGLFHARLKAVEEFLNKVEHAKRNEFVNYIFLLLRDDLLTTLAAILICVSTVRLWKLLRFGTIFKIMEKTLVLSTRALLALLLDQVVLVLGFAFCGYILFGKFAGDFKDIPDTIISLMLTSLNFNQNFDHSILTYHHGVIGYLFYSSFMIITLLIYTVYVSIIMLYYLEAQLFYSKQEETYTVTDYVKDEFSYYQNWMRPRLKAGHDVDQFVTPKSNEHRYADCLTLPHTRMEAMKHIVKGSMFEKCDDIKAESMLRCLFFLNCDEGDDNEFFFKSRMIDNRIKLVSDAKIVKMEQVVQLLLMQKKLNKRKEAKRNKAKRTLTRTMTTLNGIDDQLKSILNIFNNIVVR